jgi:hypothetical protein
MRHMRMPHNNRPSLTHIPPLPSESKAQPACQPPPWATPKKNNTTKGAMYAHPHPFVASTIFYWQYASQTLGWVVVYLGGGVCGCLI